ncbi:RICIN domain-containing protein [Streptomyces sp. NPDC101490]|uniref:RICIN domain-containing protein n=1 Tax=Streptomyces sp. NPDC101490 TaxID=3366143 RepID=UPI00382BD261
MSPGEHVPDPRGAGSPAEFRAHLQDLKERSGLTYRDLAARAAERGDVLPRSTVANMLARATLPREELLTVFVRACGLPPEEAEVWRRVRDRLARREPYGGGGTGPDPGAGGAADAGTAGRPDADREAYAAGETGGAANREPDGKAETGAGQGVSGTGRVVHGGGPVATGAAPGAGAGPDVSGSGPATSGAGRDVTGVGRGATGADPDTSGTGPGAGGSGPDRTGPDRSGPGPGGSGPGADGSSERGGASPVWPLAPHSRDTAPPPPPQPFRIRRALVAAVALTGLVLAGVSLVAALRDGPPTPAAPREQPSRTPAASVAAPAAGEVRIRVAGTGFCLGERPGVRTGQIHQLPCAEADMPRYTLVTVGAGRWRIRSDHPDFGPGCSGVPSGGRIPGAAYEDSECGDPSRVESFVLEPFGTPVRGHRIVPVGSATPGSCVTVTGDRTAAGARLTQAPCAPDAAGQLFAFEVP